MKPTDRHLVKHCIQENELQPFQRNSCVQCFTETASVRIHNNMPAAVDQGPMGTLAWLELFPNIGKVDHSMLSEMFSN